MKGWRALPPDLETKREQKNTVSGVYQNTKEMGRETGMKKGRKIQRCWLSDCLCLILCPSGTGLNQNLLILDRALA